MWLAARLRLFSSKIQGGTRYLTIPMSKRRTHTYVCAGEFVEEKKESFNLLAFLKTNEPANSI
jgi:hypothetical protein